MNKKEIKLKCLAFRVERNIVTSKTSITVNKRKYNRKINKRSRDE